MAPWQSTEHTLAACPNAAVLSMAAAKLLTYRPPVQFFSAVSLIFLAIQFYVGYTRHTSVFVCVL